MQVRLFKPSVGKEELEAIRGVFERSWLGLGPKVIEFENEWTKYIGAASSVGVNSATAALHLALTAFGFPTGKKVLVPAITFVSTAAAALYNGLQPVFVDVDHDTLSMDLQDLERRIDSDCVAVVPVHMGGHPVPMDRLMALAKKHNLAVVEDCAHCAGGEYQGKKLGTWGDIGCFSFEEKKCMTTGDGGMLCSNRPELIEPLRAHRWVGIDKDTWKRELKAEQSKDLDARGWYYEVAVLGYKYNMNDLAASIGLVQLKKLDAMNRRRTEIISQYLDEIKGLEQIQPLLPYELHPGSSYWVFGVRSERRDDLILFLKHKGIATGVHYMPLPLHPLFKKANQDVPVAKAVWEKILTLPLHADLTDEEVKYVSEALREFDDRS